MPSAPRIRTADGIDAAAHSRPARRDWPGSLAACLLAAIVVIVGIRYGARAAGGSDSFGYVSQAELLARGQLTFELSWTEQVPLASQVWPFTPLGYAHVFDGPAIAPTYAPGYPLLMAAARRLGGACAMFLVVPLCGGLLVLLTYGIGRTVASAAVGLTAALLLATSPAFLRMLVQAMSDIPSAAAWACAVYGVTRRTTRGALAAGIATSVGILIRPNLAPVAAVCGAALLVQVLLDDRQARVTGHLSWGTVTQRLAAFGLSALPGPLAIAWLNARFRGSPLSSGYGELGDLFSWGHVWTNAERYASWAASTETPLILLAIVGLVWPWRPIWPKALAASHVVMLVLLPVAVVVPYLTYQVFQPEEWHYLRFLLPAWPLVMVALASVLVAIAHARLVIFRAAASIAIVFVAAYGIRESIARDTFSYGWSESKYARVARLVHDRTAPNAVIVSMLHSGSLRLYGGRTSMRWDYLDGRDVDIATQWFRDHQVRVYALLDTDELSTVQKRFPGTEFAERLVNPVMVYRHGAATIRLYDIERASTETSVETVDADRSSDSCVEPAPPPQLRLRP